MDFAFSGDTAIGGECRRILLGEAEGAVARLASFERDPDLAIHETRKHNKRMRGIFLFARPVLTSDDISRANRLVRDAAKRFSHARDAFVMQETCGKLADRFELDPGDPLLKKIQSRLASRHQRILKELNISEEVLAATKDFRQAAGLIEAWDWDQVTLEVVFRAVVSNYRLGLDDYEKARSSRDPDECHEWRKRAKFLSYHLSLLNFLDPALMSEWAVGAEELASWLGEHHDLAVLEQTLGKGGNLRIKQEDTRFLVKLAEERRRELESAAFERGRIVYRETPEELHRTFADLVSAVA